MSPHITQATELIDWIVSNGGYFHPSAKLRVSFLLLIPRQSQSQN